MLMNKLLKNKFIEIQHKNIENQSFDKQIEYVINHFDNIVLSTSFSYEDQLLTFFLRQYPIEFFTLDTGRLFEETYETWNETVLKYKIRIKTFTPTPTLLSDFLTEKGPNSFYQSVENRKQCCDIRKVFPLKEAIKNKEIWITGLRAEHSPNRKDMTIFEWDETNQIIKFNPLLHWKTSEVIDKITKHEIPFNKLHKKGFVSIGCAPCTRAIKDGEDFRAGRWWWEDASKKECGLHIHK